MFKIEEAYFCSSMITPWQLLRLYFQSDEQSLKKIYVLRVSLIKVIHSWCNEQFMKFHHVFYQFTFGMFGAQNKSFNSYFLGTSLVCFCLIHVFFKMITDRWNLKLAKMISKTRATITSLWKKLSNDSLLVLLLFKLWFFFHIFVLCLKDFYRYLETYITKNDQ